MAMAVGKASAKKALGETRVSRHFRAPSPMNSTGPSASSAAKLLPSTMTGRVSVRCFPSGEKTAA